MAHYENTSDRNQSCIAYYLGGEGLKEIYSGAAIYKEDDLYNYADGDDVSTSISRVIEIGIETKVLIPGKIISYIEESLDKIAKGT